jgi:hypothetical protein
MRFGSLFCLLLALAGVSAGQDTNFPVGPQYLMTSNSPMFLHSIATPSLSLSAPAASNSALAAETAPEPAPEISSPSGALASPPDLSRIYWRGPEVSEPVGENLSEIEVTSAGPPNPVPASILDTGVTGMTDPQSLRERGYGVPLGDTASFWKARKPHAPRVYTNADVARLRPS